MAKTTTIVINIDRRVALAACLALLGVVALAMLPDGPRAQEVQESYKHKFKLADSMGGVGVATSSDGKYVYVAGPQGVLVSKHYGNVGSWIQTAKLK